VEPVPLLAAARPDLVAVARALDEAEAAALAIAIDDPARELPAFAEAARALSIPVLRADLLLEEFQVYESRAAGADAVLLHARLLPGEQLERLASAARATHLTACVACETSGEVQRAIAARAPAVAFSRAGEDLFGPVPRRTLIVALHPDAALPGRADALIDPSLDSAALFRAALEE
jgi:indole-3-glycerol phosphate synthase